MRPSFNIAGPCIPGEHYMLPPENRIGRMMKFIDEHKYFTLHAGHQTGKTTCLMWLEKHLNAQGRFRTLWVDIQTAREQPDPAKAFPTILESIDKVLARRKFARIDSTVIEALLRNPAIALLSYLNTLSQIDSLSRGGISEMDTRPLVILFDEADGLVGETMVSFLTQLRAGYISRNESPFPASIALVGRRQVRDYVISSEDRRAVAWLGTSSPFNIAADATTMDPFTYDEVVALLAQHTKATSQPFQPEAIERIYDLGAGHPWLTNAMAEQITNWDVEDRSVAITAEHVDAAKETIILARRTHIDSLMARLHEPRAQRILDPMLAGQPMPNDILHDDVAYLIGLGLIRMVRGECVIANPIYREVVARSLTYVQQIGIHHPTEWYVRPDGSLDMLRLMAAWQKFWRIDGHVAADGFNYRESGPHLMLMAFLQRVVNSGSRIEREYGLGRGALDLLIEWNGARHAIEVKLRRDTETEQDALDQIAGYLDHLGLDEGWLIMFDLRKGPSWSDKLTLRNVTHAGKQVHIVGC